ncbi:MAG: hypothetical protein ACOCX9_01365 [Spirochaetota bacterium]
MLRESTRVGQKEDGVFRRWFHDDFFDLIVWYRDDDLSVKGFQLCYDGTEDRYAITWHKEYGFSHDMIDESRSKGNIPGSPVLMVDGEIDFKKIIAEFRERSNSIDSTVVELVIKILNTYSEQ